MNTRSHVLLSMFALVFALGCDNGADTSIEGGIDGTGTLDAGGDAGSEASPGPSIDEALLPQGRVGESYAATITARGGTGNLVWSVRNGPLPEGLALTSGASAAATISGTPVHSGQVRLDLQVIDELGRTATAPVSFRVRGRPSVVYPTGGFIHGGLQIVDLGPNEATTAEHFAGASSVGLQPNGSVLALWMPGENGGLFALDFGGLGRSAPVRFAPADARYVGWSADGSQFGYVVGEEIFVLDPLIKDPPITINHSAAGQSLVWAMWAGNSLVFGTKGSIGGSEKWTVYLVETRPTSAPRVLENRPCTKGRPSPDGRRLAYLTPSKPDMPETEPWDLMVVGIDGHPPVTPVRINERSLTSAGVDALRWAADSTKLVFTTHSSATFTTSLWFAHFDGGSSPIVRHLDGGQASGESEWRNVGFFDISPDSKGVAYTASPKVQGGLIAELWYADFDVTKTPRAPRSLSGPSDPAANPRDERQVDNLVWSNDGGRLVFTRRSDVGGNQASQAFLVDMTVTPASPLRIDRTTVAGPVTPGEFSPDSTKYLLRWGQGANVDGVGAINEALYLIDFRGGGPTPPTRINAPLSEGATLAPVGFNIAQWSGDSSRLLYLARVGTRSELFLVDLVGASPTVKRISQPDRSADLWYTGNFIEP